MSILDRLLPEPEFIVRDPAAATQEMIANYEQLSGKKLYPAQVERLEINNMAYRDALLRENVQDAGKLGLVRFSRFPILDFLGENVGVTRCNALPATTTMRITFAAALTAAHVIPAYTLFSAGEVVFQTLIHTTVAAGCIYADVAATCTKLGSAGNGFVVGQINTLVTPIDGVDVASVRNLTESSAGAEQEDDDHLRERIVLAPQSFSNAGSEGAYKFWAMSAHQDIVDVAVRGPETALVNGVLVSTNNVPLGCVYLYPLTTHGLPSADIKSRVYQTCSKAKTRPITDHVVVFDPVVFDYSIVARITPYKNTDTVLVESSAKTSIMQFVTEKSAQLGVDVVRVQIEKALQSYGVKDVELLQPTSNRVIAPHEWARCVSVDVQLKAAEGV